MQAHADRLRRRHPTIEKILWFGSRVHGTPTPGSDVDLCIVLTHDERPVRDRVPDFLPFGFPVGIDVFPYTVDELRELEKTAPAWHRALTSGREV